MAKDFQGGALKGPPSVHVIRVYRVQAMLEVQVHAASDRHALELAVRRALERPDSFGPSDTELIALGEAEAAWAPKINGASAGESPAERSKRCCVAR